MSSGVDYLRPERDLLDVFKDQEKYTFVWKSARFHSVSSPLIAVAAYLVIIFSLQYWRHTKAPLKLKMITTLHNTFLCVLSVAMTFGTLWELFLYSREHGVESVLCDSQKSAMKGRLGAWMYIFYASKYYELLDTVIMCLKKKPLSFLHVYHHSIVLPLMWTYMETSMTIYWIVVVANSFVHVLMYYYYVVSNFGIKVWWKKYITIMQIIQFIIDLTATWPFPFFHQSAGCAGTMRAWGFGQLVGFSFFFLFWDFYRQSYREKKVDMEKKQE